MSKELQPLEEMFADLISPTKWFGFGIGDGWRELVSDACQAFRDSLPPEDLKLLKLIQVKEKLGGLRIYYEASGTLPVDVVGSEGVARLEVSIDPDRVRLSDDGLAIARRIVDRAEQKAARTCEECGSPGRLYGGNYVQTLCDGHAIEKEKVFPKAYGELLECRPHRFKFPDRFHDDDPIDEKEAICDHRMYFKNTVADIWYWVADPQKEQWFFLEDVPEHLVNAFFDYKDAHKERHYLPYSAPGDDRIQTLCIDDFLTTLNKVRKKEGATSILEPYFTLPAGCRVDPRTQLERDIAEIHALEVSITAMVPSISLGGFAVGMMTASQLPQLFNVTNSVMGPELVDAPIHYLQSELAQIEKMKTKIEAALTHFEDKK